LEEKSKSSVQILRSAKMPERSPGTEEHRCNANGKGGALYPSATLTKNRF
jgi:hypothetical protein